MFTRLNQAAKSWQRVQGEILNWLRFRRGVLIRSLICWSIGLTVFLLDERNSYDLRFQLRGSKTHSEKILLVNVSPPHLNSNSNTSNVARALKFSKNLSVSLEEILNLNPRKIGVLLSTDKGLQPIAGTAKEKEIFENKKIVWNNYDDSFKHSLNLNLGAVHFLPDSDFTYRRYHPNIKKDFVELVSEIPIRKTQMINFMGAAGTFSKINLEDLLNHPNKSAIVSRKIILVNIDDSTIPLVNTPVGPLTRSEFFANLIEGNIENKWILRLENITYHALLLVLLIFSVWLLMKYPQTVSFVFFIWVATTIIATSLWFFDTYYIWIPIVSPISQLIATFAIFISYQLAVQEKSHWRLRQKARAVQEIEQLKGNFISLFSHDLKTPIAKIQAIVDRMLTQDIDEKYAKDLKSLRRSSDELYKYIHKILHISKVESRQVKLRKDISDINEIIKSVKSSLSPLASEKGIKIDLNLSPLFSIDIDEDLIEEVILNIVDNAIKYSPEKATVYISTKEVNDLVQVKIKDEGQGISDKDQINVWNKFSRGKKQSDDMKGTGLGLYLSKYFIELHEGEISLSSEIGKGTEVTFTLPLESNQSNVAETYYYSPNAFSSESDEMELKT